ncbi:MAG: exopolyphosphatase [Chlorobi bacterium]|nr:exopolyphosphatase [Chlorobiota bacterium]
MTIAIIDLGTNTFNLLVARTHRQDFTSLYNEKQPVKLGSGGIHRGMITPDAFNRAVKAMTHYRKILEKWKPDEIRAYGTSALRSARNGSDLIKNIFEKTGIRVKVISGKEEAGFVFRGISAAISLDEPYLVMDIGGGSVEFILANKKEKWWEQSFPLGIARLLARFHPSDPVSDLDIKNIEEYLGEQLEPLIVRIRETSPQWLVGASGTFDTLYSIAVSAGTINEEPGKTVHAIPATVFRQLYDKLIASSYAVRRSMPGLVWYRADMIVVAAIFVNFVLSGLDADKIIQTSYALKEGAVLHRMEQMQ